MIHGGVLVPPPMRFVHVLTTCFSVSVPVTVITKQRRRSRCNEAAVYSKQIVTDIDGRRTTSSDFQLIGPQRQLRSKYKLILRV